MRFPITQVLFYFVTISTLAGCDSNDLVDLNRDDLAAANLSEGVHKKQVSLGGGKVMRYMVSVPRISHGRTYPLIIALHGAGPRSPWMSESYLSGQVIPGLKALNAIIVAPDVVGSTWTDPTSDEAVVDMVRIILSQDKSWPVDPDRVVVTGMSAGGIGTWAMTLKHPDLFSAGIPVAADPLVGDRGKPGAVPLFIIHGDRDETFNFDDVAREVAVLEGLGVTYHFEVAEDTPHSTLSGYQPYMENAAEWLLTKIW